MARMPSGKSPRYINMNITKRIWKIAPQLCKMGPHYEEMFEHPLLNFCVPEIMVSAEITGTRALSYGTERIRHI